MYYITLIVNPHVESWMIKSVIKTITCDANSYLMMCIWIAELCFGALNLYGGFWKLIKDEVYFMLCSCCIAFI